MYNNFQQPPVYESTGSYTQPVYSTQYSQIPFANETYMNQPSQPIYESAPSQPPPPYPISTGPQYANNTYMNQQPQPIYQTAPQQPQPIYQPVPQQTQSIYQTAPQQPQPIYQPVPQQPPPPYATTVQSKLNSIFGQQQPQNNPRPSASPSSPGYQWPHKSVAIVCPKCGASVTTRVETKITPITIIAAALLLCFSCILACLPFCIPACKRVTHYCPHCKSALGVRRELT